MFSSALFLAVTTEGVLAALSGDQQTLLLCTFLSAVLGPIAVVTVTAMVARKNRESIKAVHDEVRPPSQDEDGTTAGAYSEFTAHIWPWIFAEITAIREILHSKVHAPPPVMPKPPKGEEEEL